jgi:peptidoglycan/xylan/chitin deacetylase (PgdA/CDA1 family)
VDWQAFLDEKQPYLTREQIRQMHAEGFTIGAHTLTHRKLVDLSNQEIETEIVESCQIVGEITGQEIVPFSFPHSAWGLDRAHLADIRTRHPKVGLLFDTKGLRQDAAFIQNRVWTERSLPNLFTEGQGAAGIREHLRQAYQEAWVDEMMAKGRGLRGHNLRL